jgi:hypothetical protein
MHFQQIQYGLITHSQITVGALEATDLLQPTGSRFRRLMSSESADRPAGAEARRLVSIRQERIMRESPSFAGVDSAWDIAFNELQVNWNHRTIAALSAFVRWESSAPDQRNVTEALPIECDGEQESAGSQLAHAGDTQDIVTWNISVSRFCTSLNREQHQTALMSIEMGDANWHFRIDSSGCFKMTVDVKRLLARNSGMWSEQVRCDELFAIAAAETTPAIHMEMLTSKGPEGSSAASDTTFVMRVESIQMTYVQRIVLELTRYFFGPGVLGALATSSEQLSSSMLGPTTGAGATSLSVQLEFAHPILLFPSSDSCSDFWKWDLGRVHVETAVAEAEGNPDFGIIKGADVEGALVDRWLITINDFRGLLSGSCFMPAPHLGVICIANGVPCVLSKFDIPLHDRTAQE